MPHVKRFLTTLLCPTAWGNLLVTEEIRAKIEVIVGEPAGPVGVQRPGHHVLCHGSHQGRAVLARHAGIDEETCRIPELGYRS
jgi:hypothetical protein